MGDNDSVPTTLSGAVSVDTQRLEGIFQAVIGRLDQQGAQIQALAVLNPLHHHQALFKLFTYRMHWCCVVPEKRLQQLRSVWTASRVRCDSASFPRRPGAS